ncbi:DNA-formamidopyrimidine glycosylase family protein [Micrococcus sp.]|uniref:DNA-formamidopyrimidine glycosylase family protein n=1 Tax=Micrococcus sp. TaxID=1271 RepID=UPI002A9162B8|nr:DNA-formamidopyrimidine glycosylase family protein [Micrococcus sp.]MDY6056062.1 DNA-formamidopyrimidine glycosylase family protein [Micrococcus sp.]
MPEGDSLVRAAHRLRPVLAGRTLAHADLRVPRLATARLAGWTVAAVEPQGKWLLLRLTPPPGSAAAPHTLASHLKMEGRWLVTGRQARWAAPGWQVRAVLETGEHRLLGAQLGRLELVPTAHEDRLLGHLGPDLLDPAWDGGAHGARLLAEGVRRLTARPERPVGLALLDQSVVAGIGNIYRCESLLLAGLDPHRPVGSVPDAPGLLTLARDLLRANVPPAAPYVSWPRTTTGVRADPSGPYGLRVDVVDRGFPPGLPGTALDDAGTPLDATRPGPDAGTGGAAAPEARPARRAQYWVYGHRNSPCGRCGGPVTFEEFGSPQDDERQLWWCRTCQR